MALVDEFPQHMARPEYENAAGEYRHLLTGLGITAYALPLLANRKTAKRRYLDAFTLRESIADFIENGFDQRCGFVARETDLLVNRLA
jgi:hypothetical protein